MNDVITFTKVKLPYGWLGNMSPHPVTHNNILFPTTEHLFQALRFDPTHPIISEINKHNSPMRAKMMIKSVKDDMIVVPRSNEDIENMLKVLLLKIETHENLKEELLTTGDLEIIEDVTARPNDSGVFWGAALINGQWTGQNILGKCWMAIRTNIRSMG